MVAGAPSNTYRFGLFRLDSSGADLSLLDQAGTWTSVTIGSRALDLLLLLLHRHGEILTRDEIMDAVWPGVAVEESNLTVQISALRRILDHVHAGPSYIQTISGRGYRFLPTVRSEGADVPIVNPAMLVHASVPDRRRRLSIIVSPFRNLSDDQSLDHLADIITDNLTTDLSYLPGVFVNAGPLVGTHGFTTIDVRQVGIELGVSYLTRGAIRGTAHRTVVSFQLIDVDSLAQIWAERFEIDRTDISDADDEIAGRMVRTVYLKLIDDVSRQIDTMPRRDWTSYDLIMRGRALRLQPISPKSRHDAVQCFEHALSMDPRSAAAKLGVSTVLISNLLDGWSESVKQDEARAEQLLLEVLHDDAGIPDAHASTGMLRRLQGRLSDSATDLRLAAGLAPNNLLANGQLAITMVHLGQPDAAIPLLEKCLRWAPHDTSTPINQVILGLSQLLLGRVDEAIIYFRNSRAGNPRLYYAHWFLAAALGLRGELSEAGYALRQAVEIRPDLGCQSNLDEMLKLTSPKFLRLYRGTVYAGLLQAGLRKTARHFAPIPDE